MRLTLAMLYAKGCVITSAFLIMSASCSREYVPVAPADRAPPSAEVSPSEAFGIAEQWVKENWDGVMLSQYMRDNAMFVHGVYIFPMPTKTCELSLEGIHVDGKTGKVQYKRNMIVDGEKVYCAEDL